MGKLFNTAGPSPPDIHYTLAPKQRINWPEPSGLIGAQKYFVLAQQTGGNTVRFYQPAPP